MAEDKFTYTAKKEDEQYQIKDILRHNFTFSSRLRKKLKQNNSIFLNGVETVGWVTPKEGDVISVRLPDEMSNFEPEDIPVYPIYEDDDLLIINKQPGYVVHPTRGQPNHTMANAIMKYMLDTGQNFKIRFVNRLDRDTSGVLVIAKNSYSQEELTKQMKRNTTRKYYTALLCGIVKDDAGTVNLPIGRPDMNRVERGVLAEEDGGYASVTHYRVLERFPGEFVRLDSSLTVESGFVEGQNEPFSEEEAEKLFERGLIYKSDGYTLCELLLETGRTHQIRVHMGALGHFVLGDTLYGGVLCRKTACGEEQSGAAGNTGGLYVPLAERQLLHARRLCFEHPVTKEHMEVEAPLPEDFNIGADGTMGKRNN